MARSRTTTVKLDDVRSNRQYRDGYTLELCLTTDKAGRDGIASNATVDWVRPSSSAQSQMDYRKTVHFTPVSQITQRAIDKQHTTVFTPAAVDTIVAEVKEFYASGQDDPTKPGWPQLSHC